jgi:hypothetical protein
MADEFDKDTYDKLMQDIRDLKDDIDGIYDFAVRIVTSGLGFDKLDDVLQMYSNAFLYIEKHAGRSKWTKRRGLPGFVCAECRQQPLFEAVQEEVKGEISVRYVRKRSRFCPNCGAKMFEDAADEGKSKTNPTD